MSDSEPTPAKKKSTTTKRSTKKKTVTKKRSTKKKTVTKKRSTKKKAASTAVEAVAESTAAVEAVTDEVVASEPTPEPEKPKAPRKTKSKPKAKAQPAAEAPGETNPEVAQPDLFPEASDQAPAEPAEASRPPHAAPPQSAEGHGQPGPEEGGEKRKRRRRRRRRRKSNGDPLVVGGSESRAMPHAEPDGNVLPPPKPKPAAIPATNQGPEPEPVAGILELGLREEGRIRQLDGAYHAHPDDPVLTADMVDGLALRPGVQIEAMVGPYAGGRFASAGGGGGGGKKKKRKKPAGSKLLSIGPQARVVTEVKAVDGMTPEDYNKQVPRFDDLTTIMPQPRLTLEYPDCPPSCRLIDLFCPIGFGTRGMIVSPPKAGKTTLLQQIAFAIQKNHPEVEVYALLIDERPEEVTEFRRNVPCTVWASSNDHAPERHVGLAINSIEKCRRHAEEGRDVVVLLDSLTRLGRAFNTAPGLAQTGRTLTGGLDAGALSIPKQIFGAARKFEEGGSLTIVASALVDTGSKGDQVIFEEFKGTGNMELVLDRKIAEQRMFPAINLAASGTRNEHLLVSEKELDTVTALRRRLLNMQPVMQIDQLLKALRRYKTNDELVGDAGPQGSAVPAAPGPRVGF